ATWKYSDPLSTTPCLKWGEDAAIHQILCPLACGVFSETPRSSVPDPKVVACGEGDALRWPRSTSVNYRRLGYSARQAVWHWFSVEDAFAAVVGCSEAGARPDAVDVAWIRRVVPDERDANRSRWPTDPTWRVVQDAPYAVAPAQVRRLLRRRQRGADVAVLDRASTGIW